MSKERLEDIKNRYMELEYDFNLRKEDIDWLIKQAEHVEKLKKEKDEWKDTAQSYYMTNQELREQNKHYRQVLAFYANKDNYKDMALFDDETMYDEDGLMANEQEYAPPAIYYDNGEKARQALEVRANESK